VIATVVDTYRFGRPGFEARGYFFPCDLVAGDTIVWGRMERTYILAVGL
jgi:hypothetical protein